MHERRMQPTRPLRVSEVANLKVPDIDSERMTLRVEQGSDTQTPSPAHRCLVAGE
jgi:hypothetical protein